MKKIQRTTQLMMSSLFILALNTNLTACMTTSENKPSNETSTTQSQASANTGDKTSNTPSAAEEAGLPQVPSGVALANNKDAQFAEKLTTLQRLDPKAEAEQNIADKNYVLKAASLRGTSIPGVSTKDYEGVKDKCTLKFVDGLGDVIYGPNHKAYRKQVTAQAKVYNEVMFAACQKL